MPDNKKYPSKYSACSEVSAAQYITELICEKKARMDKKDLPKQFWQLPIWKSYYKQQIIAAHGLLKIYDSTAIVNALRNKKAWNIFSLRAPHLDPIIEEEATKIETNNNQKTSELSIADKDAAPRPSAADHRQSIIQKLRGL